MTIASRSSLGRALGALAVDVLIAIVLVLLSGAAALALLIAWYGKDAMGEPAAQGALAVASVAAMALAAAGLTLWRRPPRHGEWWHLIGAFRLARTWGLGIALGLAMLLLNLAIERWAEHAGLQGAPTNAALVQAIGPSHPVLLLALITLAAPVTEELMFRRCFFERLHEAGWPRLGVLASAALFAFAHELPGSGGNPMPTTLLLWGSYGFMGASLAIVYWRSGTLAVPIIAHATNNAIAGGAWLWSLGHP